MLNQGPGKREWFSSYEYKAWFFGMFLSPPSLYLLLTVTDYPGSFISVLGLPLTVLAAKNDIVLVTPLIRISVESQTE
jgi:hypothetical protein